MTYVSAERRKKSATVRVKEAGGKEKAKFPIDSAKTAESAIHLIGHAKPALTPSQRSAVLRKAAKYGAKPKSDLSTKKTAAKKGSR